VRDHRRSRSSTSRRTLAGLLLHEQHYRTRWADRVVLVDEDEARLTDWMAINLRVSWCQHPSPRDVASEIIRALHPAHQVELMHLVKADPRNKMASVRGFSQYPFKRENFQCLPYRRWA
jgi:hypothetical protein